MDALKVSPATTKVSIVSVHFMSVPPPFPSAIDFHRSFNHDLNPATSMVKTSKRSLDGAQRNLGLPRGVDAAPDFATLHPGYATEAPSWKELLVGFFVALI
jgi:hypothetical protein